MIAALALLVAACGEVTVLQHEVEFAISARRAEYAVERPALRGFRAGIGANADDTWPILAPAGSTEVARAAELVQKRLAHDGLPATLVRVLEILGHARFQSDDQLDLLRQTGLPVDWLTYFSPPVGSSVVQYVAQRLAAGEAADAVIADLARVTFAFRPTIAGFEVATESGEHDIECIRLQIGAGHYYSGEGDGGIVDMPRELLTKIENVAFVASIQDKDLESFRALASEWKFARGSSLTLLPQFLAVSQWAQDNGKNGIVESKGTRSTATLVPRYASRGEDGARFVPGDTFALEAFAATGRRVEQSPLLFQGGDLIPVLDPKTGKRQMIVGEAELFRNMTLGLTRAQVLEALRIEFGVERCIVLPATSFHVDYEVTLRSTPDGLVAFMNDSSAAARLVVECSIPALERAKVLAAEDVTKLRADIAAGQWPLILEGIAGVLSSRAVGFGAFPESFAKHFAVSPVDSGVGNVQRFLLALDVLTAERSDTETFTKMGLDPHLVSYLSSLRRREVERQMVARALANEGIRIVGVPSTSEGMRSLNPINGVHTKGAYYMPAYGGLFADFDAAARKVFEDNLGAGVKVVPILAAESLRREGAVHCAVSVIPRL
ncbi:MAG: hypothetical protein JNL28_10000 [Planctomycetes bacterium]|nr:hypothetical protein [Planctomycetota bacterium]